jgi:hypothetical protein
VIAAGFVYAGLVYAVGFALGALRVLYVAPWIGMSTAIWIEIPLMLGVSWLACGFVLRRSRPAPTWGERARMGAAAFAVLIAGEIAVGVFAFGRSPVDALEILVGAENLPGLCTQILFALMPLVRLGRR